MVYAVDFQVWRPSPTVDDSTGTGCYSLVGNNRFTSIPLSGGVAQVTPSPQDYIQFRPGDVLGFYVEEAIRATDGVVILTTPSSLISELVWYASIAPTMATSQNGDCPYSIGNNGALDTLTRAAPIISIDTGNNIFLIEMNSMYHSYTQLLSPVLHCHQWLQPSLPLSHPIPPLIVRRLLPPQIQSIL